MTHKTYKTVDEYECKCGSTKINVYANSLVSTDFLRHSYECRSCGRTSKADIKPITW